MTIRPDIVSSPDQAHYDGLAQRYHNYWSLDPRHLERDDHEKIRGALAEVLKRIPTDGAIAFCGTGPEIAHRDLDPTLMRAFIQKYPTVILSDFSQQTLQNTFGTVAAKNSKVAESSHLVIRDYSRKNFSSKMDFLLRKQLEDITTIADLDAFLSRIENDVGIQEISRVYLPRDQGIVDPRLRSRIDDEEGLRFKNILKIGQPIRLIVANLLISGMFAVIEMDFRNKLAWLREKNPKKMTLEKMHEALSIWHALILQLNNKCGKDFVSDALQANTHLRNEPPPTVFLSVDEDVTYTDLDSFPRIQTQTFDKKLPTGLWRHRIDHTLWNHSHERIPHTHSVSIEVIERKQDMPHPPKSNGGPER